jgi:hypothetical protein
MAAPEGSVTWPRNTPTGACGGAVWAAAGVTHWSNKKKASLKLKHFRTFIPSSIL